MMHTRGTSADLGLICNSLQEQDNSTRLAVIKEKHQDKSQSQSVVAFEDSSSSAAKEDAKRDAGNSQSA